MIKKLSQLRAKKIAKIIVVFLVMLWLIVLAGGFYIYAFVPKVTVTEAVVNGSDFAKLTLNTIFFFDNCCNNTGNGRRCFSMSPLDKQI